MSEEKSKRVQRLLAAVGALITAAGLIRRGKIGLGLSLVGSNLAYRGLRGNLWVSHFADLYRAVMGRIRPAAGASANPVDARSG